MKLYKISMLLSVLLITACHHHNPLKTNAPKDVAYFLMNASANVEKRLHFAIKEGDLGMGYLECMEGKKSPEIHCEALYQGMVAFAKEGHYPKFIYLTLSDLKDQTVFKGLADDYVEIAVANWPRFFPEKQ